MNKYEAMYILKAEMEEEARKAEVEKYNALIASNGGTLEEANEWGRRKLAYPIEDLTEGYYVLLHFSAGPDFPRELERVLQISENVLRYLVIRLED